MFRINLINYNLSIAMIMLGNLPEPVDKEKERDRAKETLEDIRKKQASDRGY